MTAEVELVTVSDRKLTFKAVCRHEMEVISERFHERFIIDAHRFMVRLRQKRGVTA